ncbi:MAG: hypothetical protein LQ352_007960, partial [Teloschistes flavicans]
MVGIKILLALAFGAVSLAAPDFSLERRQCVDTCGSTCYYQSDINEAVSTGCNDLKNGNDPGGYPHQYNDYEGFSFPSSGPYYEFPILKTYKPYTGGSPGADRVIFTKSCAYQGVITHTGADGNDFLQCIPDEPPPSYDAATAPQTHLAPPSSGQQSYRVRNGIPPEYRRSMEDEGRPLPTGWVRQYDSEHHHQFFVDTTKDPPRSIWHHPYDDDEYMNTLTPNERQKIRNTLRVPNQSDIAAESSDEDGGDHHPSPASHSTTPSATNPSTSSSSTTAQKPQAPPPKQSFGRKMKDKLTQTTHEQREQQRRHRAIAEQQAYDRHRQLRQAMVTAMNTGQPQYIGKDRDGRDLYIEPPPQQQQQQMPLRGAGRMGYNP